MATSAEDGAMLQSNTSSDDEDVDFFEEIVKSVLETATEKLRDKMEPEGILDMFEAQNVLVDATTFRIRDIREEPKTSDRNRQIRDICHSNPDIYVILKEALAASGQQGLLSDLENLEREKHDSLKGPSHCDSTSACVLFQQLKHQKFEVSTPTSKHVQELQQYLLNKYGKENIYWANPMDKEEVYLSEMYVQPSAKRIREINEHGQMKEVKVNEQKSQPLKLIYKDIFKSNTDKNCKNVYITGDAGTGKSTFCNRLVLNWCIAVQNNKMMKTDNSSTSLAARDGTLAAEDQELLSSFSFLFHINLRDTETTYHVEDMIRKQLLLSNSPETFNISDILKNERCLIVCDGLDEWSCPQDVEKCPNINENIPGRNTANKNCTFITTTRNWKYDVIAMTNKDIDKHVELSGIDTESSEILAERILDCLNRDSILKENKKADEFLNDVRKKKLNAFLTVPFLLIQLTTLWFFGKDFGNSQLQLYCSMLELMFERSEKNLPEEIPACSSTAVTKSRKLPECFSTKDHCQKYAELLHCLAKLAFKALFNKQKEEALVFKSSKLEIFGISPSNIKLCLHCGILSQCKDYGNRTGKYKKFSFLHKKVQECLAALYLVTNDKTEDIMEEVKQFCNSVETILEMNQLWLFVAGMDPDMTRQLFEHFAHVVSADDRVKTHRQTVSDDYPSLIVNIQRCVSDCVSECIDNGHHFENVCLEDCCFNINNVGDVERLLLYIDMSKVKSVDIWPNRFTAAVMAAIIGPFLQCRSLQRLELSGHSTPASTVAALVDNNCGSLTALNLNINITATDKLVTAICRCIDSKSLMALRLSDIEQKHKHIDQILHRLSMSSVIRQLELGNLYCTDHDEECRTAKIDCSAIKQLQILALGFPFYLDNLQYLTHCVEEIELVHVTLSLTSLREFAHGLSKSRRHVKVKLEEVTFIEGRARGIRGFFRREMKQLTSEECGDLKDFLKSLPGLKLKRCRYDGDSDSDDNSNTWSIKFYTSSQ